MDKQKRIDLGLSVLCSVAFPGQTLTTREIAEICGCDAANIKYTQTKALKKLRKNKLLKTYFEEMKLPEINTHEYTTRY